jgi:hypothetical protein
MLFANNQNWQSATLCDSLYWPRGLKWVPHGASIWAPRGPIWGACLEPCGVHLRTHVRSQSGAIMCPSCCPCWVAYGITLGRVWVPFDQSMGPFSATSLAQQTEIAKCIDLTPLLESKLFFQKPACLSPRLQQPNLIELEIRCVLQL